MWGVSSGWAGEPDCGVIATRWLVLAADHNRPPSPRGQRLHHRNLLLTPHVPAVAGSLVGGAGLSKSRGVSPPRRSPE